MRGGRGGIRPPWGRRAAVCAQQGYGCPRCPVCSLLALLMSGGNVIAQWPAGGFSHQV